MVAGDFADFETGQLLIKKRSLCFSVVDVICDKVTWIPTNITALYYKAANFVVFSTDWPHLW